MNPEIAEYLSNIEMKLHSLLRDVQHVKERLTETRPTPQQYQRTNITFFEALSADDLPRPKSKFEQCPHN